MKIMLHSTLLASAFGMLCLSAPALAADYRIIDRIKVPDGGFDYATFDAASGKVYMPRGAFTTVIDVKSGSVSQLANGAGDHIALPIPGSSLLVLTQRKGVIRILDATADKVIADLPGGKNPNSAVYDATSRTAVVLNKESGNATVVDPLRHKVVGTIPISDNALEFPVSDGSGKVFDNIETTGEIAVIDVGSRKVAGRFKLNGCEEPSGLAYVAASKLLVSACGNGVAKVVRADTGKEVASVAIGHGPDAVIYDPVRKLAFVPCGTEGVLEVISLADLNHIAVVQHVQTQQGSRTGTVDPATGRLYLMASKPDLSAKVPAGGRVPRLPGSWEVLVVGPWQSAWQGVRDR